MADYFSSSESNDAKLAALMLSPAAEQLLAEVLQERREQILLTALRDGSGGKISASELARANDEVTSSSRRLALRTGSPRRRRDERQLLVLGLAGAATLVSALAVFLTLTLDIGGGWQETVSSFQLSAGVAVGALVAASYTTFSAYLASRRARAAQAEYSVAFDPQGSQSFLNQWMILEIGLREISGNYLKSGELDERPFGDVIANLSRLGAISGEAEKRIKRLLRARNAIIHGDMTSLDDGALRDDLRVVEDEINRATPA